MHGRLKWERKSDGRLLAFCGRLLVATVEVGEDRKYTYRLRVLAGHLGSGARGVRSTERGAREKVQLAWERFLKLAGLLKNDA